MAKTQAAIAVLGATMVSLAAPWAAAGAPPLTPLCRPHVIASDVVATAAARLAAGARVRPRSLIDPANGFAWPDTPIAAVSSRDGKSWLVFASDGGCHALCDAVTDRYGSITRTVGTPDDPLGAGSPAETVLTSPGLKPPIDYVGGGSVFRVPQGQVGAGNLLMVYHAEQATYFPPYRYPDPLRDQNSFYSHLGLAKSTDEGLTWTDLGAIVRANTPYSPQVAGLEIGDSNLIADRAGRYLYVYFPDRIVGGTSDTFLSVARAPMAALLDQAFDHGPPASFTKYNDGRWDQPGLGGRSSTLLPAPYPAYAGAPRLAFDDDLGRYVVILDDTHNISYAESPDGIHWSDPVLILTVDPAVGSANYGAPIGLGADPGRLGRTYSVYYTLSFSGADPAHPPGWAGAELRRLTILCAPPPPWAHPGSAPNSALGGGSGGL
jgi:hypothetical protein